MPSFLNRALGLPPAIPSKTSPHIDHHGATSSTLRRTPSAAELYPGPIKKIEDDEVGSGTGDFQEVWSSIKKGGQDSGKNPAAPPLRHSSADVWGSIFSEKKAAAAEDDTEYVHPLVKRSASCLSEKSLEICTESLGSETGADGFSSDDKNDDPVVVVSAEEKEGDGIEEFGEALREKEDVAPKPVSAVTPVRLYNVRKGAAVANRSSSSSVFPPPLPSLGQRGGGGNVRMMSRRENGRLVLEAVSVPTRNCFRAERQGGRLLLTFSGTNSGEDDGDEEVEESAVEEDDQEDDHRNDEVVLVEKEIKAGAAMVMENVLKMRGGGGGAMLNFVHYKFLCLTRTSSGPSHRLNKVVNTLDDNDHLASSTYVIPSGAVLNKYVYSWRTPKPTLKDSEATEGVVVVEAEVARGKRAGPEGVVVDYQYGELLPFLRGCNKLHQQPKRTSFVVWDTARCIVSPS